MHLKGRHWLMLWLLVFLGVLVAITTRQTAGFRTARRLRDLREERMTLEARRGDLERRIRLASRATCKIVSVPKPMPAKN